MADRGFPIQNILFERRARLVIPSDGEGQEQKISEDVKKTTKVANLSIHVKRAINSIKWFHIFWGTLPITLVPLADNIATVCAALCNLLESLVEC